MAPRLKVFRWSDGFHAYSVAVSSRPKALEAWGSDQDLFAAGLASEVMAGPDYEAAMAAPGDVIRRGESIDVGKIEKAAKTKAPKGPSAARKRKIEALEQDIARIDQEREQTLGALDKEIEDLRRQRASAEADFAARGEAAVAKLRKAKGR